MQAHDAPVTVMAMDPSGGLLATASADRSVLVWDVDGGFCTHAFRGHKGVVTSIVFHPDPKRLLVSLPSKTDAHSVSAVMMSFISNTWVSLGLFYRNCRL